MSVSDTGKTMDDLDLAQINTLLQEQAPPVLLNMEYRIDK